MTYPVLVESVSDRGYVAMALGLPDCTYTAATEEEAIQGVRLALTRRLSRSKVVQVEIPATDDPWAQWVGRFASDPTWEDFQDLMAADREALDQELADG